MSDFTTPEELQDDLWDNKYDPDARFAPDAGKYAGEIYYADLKPRGQTASGAEIGARYSLGIKITVGATQQSGVDPVGKTFFTDVFVPGGDWFDPVYKASKTGKSAAEMEEIQKTQVRSFLQAVGLTAESGSLYKTDPKVFVGAKALFSVSYKDKETSDGTMIKNMYVNFDSKGSIKARNGGAL